METPTESDLEEQTRSDETPNRGRIVHRARVEEVASEMLARVMRSVTVGARIPTRTHPEVDRGPVRHYGRPHASYVRDYGVGVAVDPDDVFDDDDGQFSLDEQEALSAEVEELAGVSLSGIGVEFPDQAGTAGTVMTAGAVPLPFPTSTPAFPPLRLLPAPPAPALPTVPGIHPALVAVAVGTWLDSLLNPVAVPVPLPLKEARRRRRCDRCVALCARALNAVAKTNQRNIERLIESRCLVTDDKAPRFIRKAYSRRVSR